MLASGGRQQKCETEPRPETPRPSQKKKNKPHTKQHGSSFKPPTLAFTFGQNFVTNLEPQNDPNKGRDYRRKKAKHDIFLTREKTLLPPSFLPQYYSSSAMVRLYIIRHGEPDYETDKANGGSLTDHGRIEAAALAPFLSQQGITHAFTSPMGRAKLTAQIALQDIPQFSVKEGIITTDNDGGDGLVNGRQRRGESSSNTTEEKDKGRAGGGGGASNEGVGVNDDTNDDNNNGMADATALTQTVMSPPPPKKNNFEKNVGIEPWCREITPWRIQWRAKFGNGWSPSCRDNNGRAIFDIPATVTRTRLCDEVEGTLDSIAGWTKACPEHGVYLQNYRKLCNDADEFLGRFGIKRVGANYVMNGTDAADTKCRRARIVIFCHGGLGLALLSHLLAIPLPMVHASMWLAPSSVTTVVFDEHVGNVGNGFCNGVMSLNNPTTRQLNGEAEDQEAMPVKRSSKDQFFGGIGIDDDGSTSLEDDDDYDYYDDGSIVLTPRAICIGGTNHLTAAGLS